MEVGRREAGMNAEKEKHTVREDAWEAYVASKTTRGCDLDDPQL